MNHPHPETTSPPRGNEISVRAAGDEAVMVQFGAGIDRQLNARARALAEQLQRRRPDWLMDVIPAYASVLVRYEPERIGYRQLKTLLFEWAARAAAGDGAPARRVEIPVRYGGDAGPDLSFVAEYTGLTEDEVVALHCEPTYIVYMLGFTPGFCYLGDLPPRLEVPRRKTPRPSLPAGAVAIGGLQTGIYSLDNSPGGWRWIGQTDAPLWDARRNPPFLLQAGDEVRFVRI